MTAPCQASRLLPIAVFAMALLTYHLVFVGYFPTADETIGHDYSFFIPLLLDGYLWFRQNGLLSIPWFTPSFCGGQPYFADPQSLYLSLPQFLTFAVDPLRAVYWSQLVMASAGFWGMFLLCRRGFALSRLAALVAATIFMFNGFFSHRMLVGHLAFHSFMLVPLTAYLLTAASQSPPWRSRHLTIIILSGLLIAYLFQSGLAAVMIPSALAIVALLAMFDFRRPDTLWAALNRGLLAALLAMALCASKLVAGVMLLSVFPHDIYLLPGLDSLSDIAKVTFTALFLPSQQAFELSQGLWRNLEWAIQPHEMAYGITLIPLAVILVGLRAWTRTPGIKERAQHWYRYVFSALILGIIVVMPFALLYYSPQWNAFLKSMPLLNSTVAPIRWLIVLLPLFALWTGMAIDQLRFRRAAAVACVIGVPVLTALEDRAWYLQQAIFDPSSVIEFYYAVKRGDVLPNIERIADSRSPERGGRVPMDGLVRHESPLQCYNALYGYRLEQFREAPLHEGPITEGASIGELNLRNPACVLYPRENGCERWDAFRRDQHEQAGEFARYRPFGFDVPMIQRAANLLSVATLVACFGLLFLLGLQALKGWLSHRAG